MSHRGISLLVLAAACASRGQVPAQDARNLLDDGRFAQAEAAARVQLERAVSARGQHSIEAAEALELLGESLRQGYQAGRPETLDVCRRALALERELLPPGDVRLARAIQSLAMERFVRQEGGATKAARQLVEEALAIREASAPVDAPGLALTYLALAQLVYDETSDLQRASGILGKVKELQDKALPATHRDVASRIACAAYLQYLAGEFEHSRESYRQAIAIQSQALRPGHPVLASTLYSYSLTLKSLGEFSEARALCEEALEQLSVALGPAHPGLVSIALGLADLRSAMGEPLAAQECLERALAIQERETGTSSFAAIRIALKLADVCLQSGATQRAQQLLGVYEPALEALPELKPWLEPYVLQMHGQLKQARGDLEGAALDFAAAVAAGDHEYGSTSPDLAPLLESRGESALRLRDFELALDSYERAAGLVEKSEGSASPQFARDLLGQARARLGLGDSAQALDDALRADTLARESLERTAGGFEEKALLDYASSRTHGLDLALAIAGSSAKPGTSERVFEALVHSRALLLDLAIGRQRSAHGLVTLAEVSAALPARSALVSYVRAGEDAQAWFAFVLRAGAESPALIPLGSDAEIDPLVAEAVDDARRRAGEDIFRSSGTALRERIWDPVAERLADSERVFLVADAGLAFVDFGALPVGDRQYLVETAPLLHELSAERDLVARGEPETGGAGLLALGGVDFDGASGSRPDRSAPRGETFGPLPGSADEVRSIGDLWSSLTPAARGSAKVELLTGCAATETAFKRLAPHHAVLHIATHGFFLAGETLPSVDGGRSPGKPVGPRTRVAPVPLPVYHSERPLELSGLALAGANLREQDGVLTSEEISCLDLSGTSWAVLSACDTGLGVSHGDEGVLGLRRAFLLAGAHTVISSLWRVNDKDAREWMVELYRARLERKLGTAEALRAADLEMLRRRREAHESTEPASWAGFVAVGDWR